MELELNSNYDVDFKDGVGGTSRLENATFVGDAQGFWPDHGKVPWSERNDPPKESPPAEPVIWHCFRVGGGREISLVNARLVIGFTESSGD